MDDGRPTWFLVWIARGLFLAGLWFAGTSLWSIAASLPTRWDLLLPELPGLGGGLLFLWGAWRMRGALRWDPPEDE